MMMVQGNAFFQNLAVQHNPLVTWVDKEAFRFNARDVCYGLIIDQRCLPTLHRIQVKRKARADNFLVVFLFLFSFKNHTQWM